MRMNAVVIAVATVLAAGCSGAGAADIRIGEVKAFRGDARVVRDGQDIALAAGTDLFEKDIVVTGPSSAVGMTFVDASRISIGPNSRLDLEEYAYRIKGRDDGFLATLKRGSLAAASGGIVMGRPEAMRVRTPTTILGVRGTSFVVRVAQ